MRTVRTSVITKALFWNVLLAVNFWTLASAFGAQVICNRIVGLTAGQRRICAAAPDAMAAVGHGIRMAKQECQQQFSGHRWNCTGPSSKGNPFGHLQITASREAAYVYAVISAGVTYALMDACSRGNISICGCDAHYASALDVAAGPPAAAWKWGGCSVDLGFGAGFARKFLDAQEDAGSDPRSLMNLHNNKAGRKIVKLLLNTDCKCHGVSGSCTMKTCWHSLPPFREVAKALMRKYRKARGVAASAAPVSAGNHRTAGRRSSKRLRLRLRSARSSANVATVQDEPKITELVYLEQSPNYCDRDFGAGSLGTHGRSCNRTSDGTDGCDLMCCGRGYNTHQFTTTKQCRCTFYWCCYVKCDTCVEHTEEYTCK